MRKISVFIGCIFAYLFLLNNQCFAATLKFDKTSSSLAVGDTVDVQVIVDAGSEQVTSADTYVTYDATVLEAQTVSNGSFFPSVSPQISSGSVYIAGMVDDPASSKTGSGTLATIKFKALKSGSTTLKYNCSGTDGPSKIVKNDVNTTNIIDCGGNGTLAVTVGGSSNTTSATATPTTATSANVTSLPKTGVFDNVTKFAIPGSLLLLLGTVVKVLL